MSQYRVIGFVLLAVVLICCCGCSDQSALVPISPPADLDELDPPVQRQYEQLRHSVGETPANSSERGAAYGALCMWYHAYKYEDIAALCYGAAGHLNADPRWPYYRAILQERRGAYGEAQHGFTEALHRCKNPEPAVLVRLGEVELQLNDLESAAGHLQRALDIDPSSARALTGLAKVALARGHLEAAVSRLELAQSLQPAATSISYSLGQVYQRLGQAERAQHLLETVPQLSRDHRPVIFDDPWTRQVTKLRRGARVISRKALAAFEREQYPVAAELFGRSLAIDPDSFQTRINYALALEKTGRLKAARRQLEEVLRREKNHKGAHLALSSVLTTLSHLPAAEQHLRAALAINPSADVHLALGRLVQVSGRLEEAVQHYEEVRLMGQPAPECRLWHPVVLTWLGRHKEALATLRQDTVLLPDDEILRLLEARLLAASPDPEVRDPAHSLQIVRRFVAEPTTLFSAETMAMALAENGRFAEAITWQRAALTTAELGGLRTVAGRVRRRLALYEDHKPCRSPWDRTEYPESAQVEPPTSLY